MKTKYSAFALAAALATITLSFAASSANAQSSGDGFDLLLGQLQWAKTVVQNNEPVDGIDQAEGLRHVLRLLDFAYDEYEKDPRHPLVARCPGLVCKIGFDSPDQTQISVDPLSPAFTYRVFGNLESADFVTFQVIDPNFVGSELITSDEMVVGEDGSYEIFLAASNTTGAPNFLGIPDGGQLIARVIFADWETEIEPSVQVEVVGEDTGLTPVPTLTPGKFFGDTLTAGLTIVGPFPGFPIPLPPGQRGILDTLSTLPYNFFMADLTAGGSFPPPGADLIPGAGQGQANNLTTNAKYDLPPDMAIIIEREESDVRAGNIQLGNRWLESLDYSSRLVSHNLFRSHQDSDGVFRYVIAHEDPGVPNWLDTRDHEQGAVFMRWNVPADPDALVAPSHIVVPLEDVWDYLPADHPMVTPEERNAELEARNHAVNRRHNPAGFASFKDSDGDGEHNSTDFCPDTPNGAEVDGDGCDQEAFCANIDVSGQGWKNCDNADFQNDEPLYAGDCEADRRAGVCLVR